jgi:ketosteroid isomerase-like protein
VRGNAARVELLNEAIDAYNARDEATLCRVMRTDVELRPPVHSLQGNAYSGHEGIRRWLSDVDESFAEAHIARPSEVRELGATLVALTSFRVRGRESQLDFESELGLVVEVEDERIVSWRGFFSHSDALAAAGA